jgi:hypothetical protein
MTPDFQTIVVFVGLLILSGFFTAIGEEAWEWMRNRWHRRHE